MKGQGYVEGSQETEQAGYWKDHICGFCNNHELTETVLKSGTGHQEQVFQALSQPEGILMLSIDI